jgi:hypothetical protein
VNGRIMSKLDLLATVNIYGEHYFTVYRRYNNVNEIVIEDYNGDIYLHKDIPVYKSLQTILCLNDKQMSNRYVERVFSFKYNGKPPTMTREVTEMLWSEIQELWYGVDMDVRGILEDFYRIRRSNKRWKMEEDDREEGELKEAEEVVSMDEERNNKEKNETSDKKDAKEDSGELKEEVSREPKEEVSRELKEEVSREPKEEVSNDYIHKKCDSLSPLSDIDVANILLHLRHFSEHTNQTHYPNTSSTCLTKTIENSTTNRNENTEELSNEVCCTMKRKYDEVSNDFDSRDEEEDNEGTTKELSNYMVLRNGTKIYRITQK